MMQTPPQNSVQ